MKKAVRVVSFVGWSGTGKTTVVKQLVAILKQRGLRVGVLKHDVHGFAMDVPGKDTWKHAQAGADWVCLSAPRQLSILRQVEQEIPLSEILALADRLVDIILVEGYKQEQLEKIEVWHPESGQPPLEQPQQLLAHITPAAIYPQVPWFSFEQMEQVADLLCALGREEADGRAGLL